MMNHSTKILVVALRSTTRKGAQRDSRKAIKSKGSEDYCYVYANRLENASTVKKAVFAPMSAKRSRKQDRRLRYSKGYNKVLGNSV